MRIHERPAKEFCEAIKEIATNDEALANLENYLAYHFGKWLIERAASPDGIVEEMQAFAKIK